jgi:hypothetical protein
VPQPKIVLPYHRDLEEWKPAALARERDAGRNIKPAAPSLTRRASNKLLTESTQILTKTHETLTGFLTQFDPRNSRFLEQNRIFRPNSVSNDPQQKTLTQ